MGKPTQIVKMHTSILDYFKMVMDFDNESQEYREVAEREFKEKLTEALNCGPATKEIIWSNHKFNR
tara:strand:- start:15351 stop:15548 length:198 start_codon:yes stop_codon:yes gene_type:complete